MKYKRDYKITISADINDNVYWSLTHKGELKVADKEDYEVILSMIEEIYNKLSKVVKEE